MTGSSRVFVNGVGLDVPPGATALDAVRGWSADAADAVVRGASIITDSRGLPAPADAPVQAGAIFRVIAARDRPSAHSRPAVVAHDDGSEES
ncbi:MAG: hypothetical protein M3282_07480 [Gemmatimonadota bacterium]|nr:hypothetical protein [Gemmatimonadota bacterium]